MHDHDFDPLAAGAAYALYRHGQDRQAEAINDAIASAMASAPPPPADPQPQPTAQRVDVRVRLDDDDDDVRGVAPINALDFATADMPSSWDDFIGQAALKRRLAVAMKSSQMRGVRMPHVLLETTRPGAGKTTVARLIAKTLSKRIFELQPPFNIYALVEAAQKLNDGDILFIDEIHLLALKRRGSEILLPVLTDHVAYIDGEAIQLADFTVIGATTDADQVAEPVLQRFKCRPAFAPYSLADLAEITVAFMFKHDAELYVDADLAVDIAKASQGTPRITEEFVMAALDMGITLGRPPTGPELLEYMEVEPDGLTAGHRSYLCALRQHFDKWVGQGDDRHIVYVSGAKSMQTILREGDVGLERIERYLMERGLVKHSPRGRCLTTRGVARAEQLINAGKGLIIE